MFNGDLSPANGSVGDSKLCQITTSQHFPISEQVTSCVVELGQGDGSIWTVLITPTGGIYAYNLNGNTPLSVTTRISSFEYYLDV